MTLAPSPNKRQACGISLSARTPLLEAECPQVHCMTSTHKTRREANRGSSRQELQVKHNQANPNLGFLIDQNMNV
eukprot:2130644-Amphidinium_carterae.1